MAIKTYTARQSVNINVGGIGGGAQMSGVSGGGSLGNTIMDIGARLLNAKKDAELNKTAANNVTKLTNKISDEEFRVDLDRDLTDLPTKVMEAGGDAYSATLDFAKKYDLDFGDKDTAAKIMQLSLTQYQSKSSQYKNDRTGFILSYPGAKEAMGNLVPEDKEYHDKLRALAKQHGVKLQNGFDNNFISQENTRYGTLVGTQKYEYLLNLQKTMGPEVFEEFLYAISDTKNSSLDITDRLGITMPEDFAKVFYGATATSEDIKAIEELSNITNAAKALTSDLLPGLTAGTMQDSDVFTQKMKQLIFKYMGNGFSAEDAAQQVLSHIKRDKEFTNNPMSFVGVIDTAYLNQRFKNFPGYTQDVIDFTKSLHFDEVKGHLFEMVYPQMIKNVPAIRAEVESEMAGGSQDVIDKEIESRTKTKLKSAFIQNMRVVNHEDGRKGFTIQIKDLYNYETHYNKNGEPLVIPYEAVAGRNFYQDAVFSERGKPTFYDLGAPFRE